MASDKAVIWHAPFTTDWVNQVGRGTLATALGMECVDIGADFLRMRMPVDERTRQPFGLLHGGASVALGETIGGVASGHVVAPGYRVVGLEINANHVRSVRDGFVTATCRPIHLGRTTHVWDIRVETAEGKLVSIIRLTNAILPPDD